MTPNVVIRWEKGLPEHRDEPWFLIPNLSGNAVQLTTLYARRMAVEELFRDGMCGRHGSGMRHTQVTTTARLDRLLLILALALILLAGLGLVTRWQFRPVAWGSSNDAGECSDVNVGQRMWDRLDVPPEELIRRVINATLTYAGNWG